MSYVVIVKLDLNTVHIMITLGELGPGKKFHIYCEHIIHTLFFFFFA